MKILILIILAFIFGACSLYKHKTENSSSQKELTVHAVQQMDSLEWITETLQLRFLSNDERELTEIIPEGKFVYQPDSGFRGVARSLRVYSQARRRSFEKDTSSFHLTAGGTRETLDSTLHQQAQQQLEETKESKLVSGWWMYALAAATLLSVIYVAWKRR